MLSAGWIGFNRIVGHFGFSGAGLVFLNFLKRMPGFIFYKNRINYFGAVTIIKAFSKDCWLPVNQLLQQKYGCDSFFTMA